MAEEDVLLGPTAGEQVLAQEGSAPAQLGKRSAGWVELAGLGVAYVIAGQYVVWNYGIGLAGWGGMVLALAIMAVMYFCLVFSLAELATIMPTAGGGYAFARRAFGPATGFIAGIATTSQYVIGVGALGLFFCAYLKDLVGINSVVSALMLYGFCMAFHVLQAKESIFLTLVVALVAAAGLLLFIVIMVPSFAFSHLVDLPMKAGAFGASALLPKGWLGIWAGLPFAMAMFMGVEGVPLAAEETRDPERDLPKGMIAAMICLFAVSLMLLLAGPGGAGAARMAAVHDPLIGAMNHVVRDDAFVLRLVNIAGLAAISGSFFALIFAYSRQLYALARAGFLPGFLRATNRFNAPYAAILVPGVVALLLTLSGEANDIIVVSIGCAILSYLFMMASHIKLRLSAADLSRPFSTPGGIVTSGVAFALSLLAFAVCIALSPVWTLCTGTIIGAFILYYLFYARGRLAPFTPQEPHQSH